MRHRGIEVVGQVVVLAQRENSETNELADDEGAGVGQPTPVRVAMLNHLPEHHEQAKRGEDGT